MDDISAHRTVLDCSSSSSNFAGFAQTSAARTSIWIYLGRLLQQLQDTQQRARCTRIKLGTSPSCEAASKHMHTSTTAPVPHGLWQFIGRLGTVLGIDSRSFKSPSHMQSKIDSICSDSIIGKYTKFRRIPAVCHKRAGFGSLLGSRRRLYPFIDAFPTPVK